MKKTRKLSILLFIVLSSVLLLNACSTKNDGSKGASSSAPATTAAVTTAAPVSTPTQAPKLPPVELTWYFPVPKAQADLDVIAQAASKITAEKINATLKLVAVDFGNYEAKLNTTLAANENVDILWTSSWLFKFEPNNKKGAFLPLDDLLSKYGMDIKTQIPDNMWNAVKINNQTMAIPNLQTETQRPGFVVRKDFADKYKLDPSTIKTAKDLEPFLEQIKKNELGIVPLLTNQDGFAGAPAQPDYAVRGISIGAHGFNIDKDGKIIAFAPNEAQNFQLDYDWYHKGYINQDAPTLTDLSGLMSKGNFAVTVDWTLKPGGEAEAKQKNGGHDVIYIPLAPATTGRGSIQATLTAINKNSKNPERAMMLLNLVNSDPQLFNILAFGIEGTHYTKINDNTVKIKADSGYAPNVAWVLGNVTNGYLQEGQAPDTWAVTKQLNSTALISKYDAFTPDLDLFKAEVANMDALRKKYEPGLNTGVYDPKTYYPKFQDELKKAGLDKVIVGVQKQLDDWVKQNLK